MIVILFLACLGLLLDLIGRWIIIRETPGLSRVWRWALALLPGAELVFIVQRGERSRCGSVLCALALALMLPLVGHLTSVLRNAGCPPTALLFDPHARALVLGESERLRDFRGAAKRERSLALKEAKMRELGDYLLRWHLLLAERRDYLCGDADDETRRFNADLAAYHALLAVSRAELAEWKGLAKGREPLGAGNLLQP